MVKKNSNFNRTIQNRQQVPDISTQECKWALTKSFEIGFQDLYYYRGINSTVRWVCVQNKLKDSLTRLKDGKICIKNHSAHGLYKNWFKIALILIVIRPVHPLIYSVQIWRQEGSQLSEHLWEQSSRIGLLM